MFSLDLIHAKRQARPQKVTMFQQVFSPAARHAAAPALRGHAVDPANLPPGDFADIALVHEALCRNKPVRPSLSGFDQGHLPQGDG